MGCCGGQPRHTATDHAGIVQVTERDAHDRETQASQRKGSRASPMDEVRKRRCGISTNQTRHAADPVAPVSAAAGASDRRHLQP